MSVRNRRLPFVVVLVAKEAKSVLKDWLYPKRRDNNIVGVSLDTTVIEGSKSVNVVVKKGRRKNIPLVVRRSYSVRFE